VRYQSERRYQWVHGWLSWVKYLLSSLALAPLLISYWNSRSPIALKAS